MEEILASIRKIISEDADNGQQPAAPPAPEPVQAVQPAQPAAKQDADVLELTHEVREEPAPQPIAAAPQPVPELAPVPPPVAAAPQAAAIEEDDVVFVSKEEPPVSSPATNGADHDGIFSEKARKAIDDAFANLDQEEEPVSAPPASPASMPPVEGNSVEAVFERAVREAVEPLLHEWMDSRKDDLLNSVKPIIRDWMDEHFPAILEGAVRDEVARAVKARGKR
ncbi:MAG TPA: DUF2497 domain-containing protein [Rhizomicrobium sp.]|jgi:hypothetical protein